MCWSFQCILPRFETESYFTYSILRQSFHILIDWLIDNLSKVIVEKLHYLSIICCSISNSTKLHFTHTFISTFFRERMRATTLHLHPSKLQWNTSEIYYCNHWPCFKLKITSIQPFIWASPTYNKLVVTSLASWTFLRENRMRANQIPNLKRRYWHCDLQYTTVL